MSRYRRILVHLSDSVRAESLLAFAARLAAEHEAELQAVHAVDAFSLGAYLSPEAAMTAAEANQQLVRERAARARERVSHVVQALGRPIDLQVPGGDALRAMTERSRVADLVVVAQPVARDEAGPTAGFASQLLVGAGCPVLFVPEAALTGQCGTRVLIAWADTRESARALRDALPILRRAEAVEVLRFGAGQDGGGETLDAVAGYLASHEVHARCSVRAVREIPFAERMLVPNVVDASIAELLLSHAADTNADLVVMGGYGHSRAYELVLGGVTRSMLASMTVPVLMSH